MLYKKQITIICIALALFAFYQSIKNPNEETIKKLGQLEWQEIQYKNQYTNQYGIAEAAKKGMSESHLGAESVRKEAENYREQFIIRPDNLGGSSTSRSNGIYNGNDEQSLRQGDFKQPTE